MTELAKAKRRIKRLENCLDAIGRIVQEADDDLTGHGCDSESESPHYRTIMRITRRMARLLPRNQNANDRPTQNAQDQPPGP
jgi:hypothetical protein